MESIHRNPGICLLLLLLFGAAGCQALRIDGPPSDAASDWLTEGDGPQRANVYRGSVAPPLEPVWEYNAGAGFGTVSPLVVGDVVLVATRKGEVHAIDLETGRRRGQETFGETIEGTPVVDDGMLYVPVGWGGRALQAYDMRRGAMVWRVNTTPIESGLLLTEGRLVAADVNGGVRAYAARDGELLWERSLGPGVRVTASPLGAAGGLVVVADDAGHVFALAAEDGTVRWRRDVAAPVLATPAAGQDALFVPTADGRLVALERETGRILWQHAAADTTVFMASPAVDGDLVVVGGTDGVLRALNAASGDVRWTRAFEGVFAAAPLLTDSIVYVGNMRSQLLALDRATGKVTWTGEVEGRIKSPLAATRHGLVVLSEPRLVYLFNTAPKDYASAE